MFIKAPFTVIKKKKKKYIYIYIYIYKSAQKNYKQPNQLKGNDIHTQKRASCEDYAAL